MSNIDIRINMNRMFMIRLIIVPVLTSLNHLSCAYLLFSIYNAL